MRGVFSLKDIRRHFLDATAETIIPSPYEFVVDAYLQVRAHIRHVQAEQIAFQQRLQAIGITRLSRMSHREVLQRYGCD